MTSPIAQTVGVSFARRYYTTLVERPDELPSFYAPTATVRHLTQPPVTGSTAELKRLLEGDASFGSLGKVSRVELKAVSVGRTASGNITVTLDGAIHGSAAGLASTTAGQPFQQVFELREVAAKAYAVVSDVLTFDSAAADVAESWALETPPMFAQQPPATAPPMPPAAAGAVAVAPEPTTAEEEALAPAAPAPVDATTASADAPAPSAPPAVPAVEEAPKAPQSFAEALKMKKATDGKKPTAPVRVTDKPATAPAADKAKEEKKKGKPAAGAAAGAAAGPRKVSATTTTTASASAAAKKAPTATTTAAAATAPATGEAKKRPARTGAGAAPVIFYDVIIKNLPHASTEETVRAMLPADIPVSLVKVESKAARSDPSDIRTFAFVQLDATALKAAGTDKKDAVAKVVAEGAAQGEAQKITFEEVREKRKYTTGADGTKMASHTRPAASGAARASTAAKTTTTTVKA